MKKIIGYMICFCLMMECMSVIVHGSTLQYSVLYYDTAQVTGCQYDTGLDIVIPETVGDYTVTKIGDGAFIGGKLTSIVIPETVTSIGNYAFKDCKDLKRVTILGRITEVGDLAFMGCKNLSNVIFLDEITMVGNNMFKDCSALKNIRLPDSVKTIGDYAFDSCNIESLVLPNNISKIGTGAFRYNEFDSIIIPDSVTEIGAGAFSHCSKLQDVILPQNIKKIPGNLFGYCDSLHNVAIPDSVTEVGFGAFLNCASLNKVIIGENVERIGRYAFSGCGELGEIVIPASVRSIEDKAFEECNEQMAVSYKGSPRQWGYIDISAGNEVLMSADISFGMEDGDIAIPFTDVSEQDWFYDAVCYNYDRQLIQGMSKTVFAPYDEITRAQMAIILYRMSGSPEVEYKTVFTDVQEGEWFADAVIWAQENKIVNGYEGMEIFGPHDKVLREQAVVMLQRYGKYKGHELSEKAALDAFEDASFIGEYAREAFAWSVANGIITGKNNTLLDPQGNMMRCEAATMLMRFMNQYQE